MKVTSGGLGGVVGIGSARIQWKTITTSLKKRLLINIHTSEPNDHLLTMQGVAKTKAAVQNS